MTLKGLVLSVYRSVYLCVDCAHNKGQTKPAGINEITQAIHAADSITASCVQRARNT